MQPRIAQPKARPFRVVASERHYPLAGWRRCWSRGDPHPFEFEDSGRPCAAPDDAGWRVEVRDATDQEGWRYGTAFERLNDHRKGGRAADLRGCNFLLFINHGASVWLDSYRTRA